MSIKIALAGNPNCGKTSIFNDLTGSTQYVGNWPGVTVEKKEGRLIGSHDIIIQDLPGIYSLSPYSLEEVVSRNYLVNEEPDVIINIVDASNIERNLYLTTQLTELGVPVVIALNMIDIIRRRGDQIDIEKLGKTLGCEVVETSALEDIGLHEITDKAQRLAENKELPEPSHCFGGEVEHALAHIEDIINGLVEDKRHLRWFSVKLFERDEKVTQQLALPSDVMARIEKVIRDCENEMEDDSVSIVINERYNYIDEVVRRCVQKENSGGASISDKIDMILTNRVMALPIFAAIMFLVYYVSVTAVGRLMDNIPLDIDLRGWLTGIGVAQWLTGLISDGVFGGVGAVLGFVPQMLLLFFFLAILEDCGYMSRVAFIMDRLFRKFGLSGKSFIPLLVGSGCSVPGIMASRTIEQLRDRRMTILTTSFIPCGAKMPVIAMIAGTFFGGAWWIAPSAYLAGIAAVVISGVILKKTRMFTGEPATFLMELPPYHMPTVRNVMRSTWERTWSFVKKAGTVILLASIAVWFLSSFGIRGGALVMTGSLETSVLASVGRFVAPLFSPLGFGSWQAAVASLLGLLAKEEIVAVFGVLYGLAEGTSALVAEVSSKFTPLSAYSFLLFNLLCIPCVAAVSAIRREMNSTRWTLFAICYQAVFAYAVSLIVYQVGLLLNGADITLWTGAALAAAAVGLWLLVRKGY